MTDSAHPAMLPPISETCKKNRKRVFREKPKMVGIFFDLKKRRIRCFLDVELLDSVETRVAEEGETRVFADGEVVGFVGSGAVETLAGASRSAGCVAGSTISGIELCASVVISAPSTYPISPRFEGKGPACGREISSDAMAASEDEWMDVMFVGAQLTQSQFEKLAPGKRG